jgi:streptomycin 6-kinase
VGALLTEAIEPGVPLVESLIYPDTETTADLLTSFHTDGVPDLSFPSLSQRVANLFQSGASPYERRPALRQLIPPDLYERGRGLAIRLAEVPPTALLHGDLTPSNILDGGARRGLVAIDPAPCLGDDVAFDAIDLLLWQAEDIDTVTGRAELLAPAIGAEPGHVIEWCIAFAAMAALESSESPDANPDRIEMYLALADLAPRSSE